MKIITLREVLTLFASLDCLVIFTNFCLIFQFLDIIICFSKILAIQCSYSKI